MGLAVAVVLAVFVVLEMALLCRRCYAWLIVAFVCYVLLLVIWMWRFLQLSWLRVKSSTVDQCRYDSFFAFKMVYLYPCVIHFLLCLYTVVTNIKELVIFNVLYTTVMQ